MTTYFHWVTFRSSGVRVPFLATLSATRLDAELQACGLAPMSYHIETEAVPTPALPPYHLTRRTDGATIGRLLP